MSQSLFLRALEVIDDLSAEVERLTDPGLTMVLPAHVVKERVERRVLLAVIQGAPEGVKAGLRERYAVAVDDAEANMDEMVFRPYDVEAELPGETRRIGEILDRAEVLLEEVRRARVLDLVQLERHGG